MQIALWAALLLLCYCGQAARLDDQTLALEAKQQPISPRKGHVVYEDGRLRFTEGEAIVGDAGDAAGVVAEGSFSDGSRHKSNFGQLRIKTLPGRSDLLQLRAAGFLEGYLTAERLFDYSYNYQYWFQTKGNGTRAVQAWLVAQDQWIRQQVAARAPPPQPTHTHTHTHTETDSGGSDAEGGFWYGVSLVLEQLDGILQGYNAAVAQLGPGSGMVYMKRETLLLTNAFGDMSDLLPIFVTGNDEEVTRDLSRLSPAAAWHRLVTGGHCSALIKVTGDLSDIMVGHTTWSTYYSMVRLYKHYNFEGLASSYAKGKRVSMPSYPGTVSSVDDFYLLTPTNLIVLETTNDVFNTSLYQHTSSQAALSYHRVFAANMAAEDGAQWVELAQMHHSGTYNNQYMVVDLKRFTPGQELQAGLLTILELLPGFAQAADVTHELERGYWPSYNVPYFPEVYERAGYPHLSAALAAKGPAYSMVVGGLSYQLAPRAKIFRRDAGSVGSLHDMVRVLRSNKWSNDSYSANDVFGTICARGDLSATHPTPYGCIDAKVTSYALALQSGALAVNGPSTESGLPAFSWSGAAAFAQGPHRGMPDSFTGRMELQQP